MHFPLKKKSISRFDNEPNKEDIFKVSDYFDSIPIDDHEPNPFSRRYETPSYVKREDQKDDEDDAEDEICRNWQIKKEDNQFGNSDSDVG